MAKIDMLTQYEVAYLESRLIRKISGQLMAAVDDKGLEEYINGFSLIEVTCNAKGKVTACKLTTEEKNGIGLTATIDTKDLTIYGNLKGGNVEIDKYDAENLIKAVQQVIAQAA